MKADGVTADSFLDVVTELGGDGFEDSREFLLGIDEAGRGPVLGPMVYGACCCPIAEQDELKSLGFADSKTLSEEKRDQLFKTIKDTGFLGWMYTVLPANFLSNQMLRRKKYNLNDISYDTAIAMIREVSKKVTITEVYVDTVGDPKRYEERLRRLFPTIRSITVSKKADSLFPIVSAASICAKVTRDRYIRLWSQIAGAGRDEPQGDKMEIGSGYPADPATQRWLESHIDRVFGFPSLVRFSWSTADTILSKTAVSVLWDDEDSGSDQLRLDGPLPQVKLRDRYFKVRRLERVVDL